MTRKKTPKKDDTGGLTSYAAGDVASVSHAGKVYAAQDGILYLPDEPWAREFAADNGLMRTNVPAQPSLVE